jgi:transcriptional regulator with XRE-family HTH domain
MAKKIRSRNFGDVIRAKLAANPELAKAVEEESFNADIAQQVFDLRTEAGLSQKALAELIGTQQSVISRIEDSDYDGHSLGMLKRIASALNRRLKVDFCAQPVMCDAEVTEFPLNWSIPAEWQATIDALRKVSIDPSGMQIQTSQIRASQVGAGSLLGASPSGSTGGIDLVHKI